MPAGPLKFGNKWTLAIASENEVEIWDVSTPENPVRRLLLSFDQSVEGVVLDATGAYLGIYTGKQVLTCRLSDSCETRASILPSEQYFISFLAVNPQEDRPWATALNLTGAAYLMDLREGTFNRIRMFRDLSRVLEIGRTLRRAYSCVHGGWALAGGVGRSVRSRHGGPFGRFVVGLCSRRKCRSNR